MPMKPHKDESQDDFMGRCVPEMVDSGKEQDQAVAACMNIWGERDKGSVPVVRRTHTSEGDGLEYILSDASVDRLGDSIDPSGWDFKDFVKNPIALFNHNSDLPIGRWKNLRVEKGALRGFLELAKAGTSARIDEIRALIEQGILRAVSVGFRAIKYAPIDPDRPSLGLKFLAQELVETSVVSIPANPNALQVAKSLKISDATIDAVFGKPAVEKQRSIERRYHGELADKSRAKSWGSKMTPLAQRIKDAEQRLVSLRDNLTEHLKTVDDSNPTDEGLTISTELNGKIEMQEKQLDMLKASEQRLAATVDSLDQRGGGAQPMVISSARPFAMPAKKVQPIEYLWRGLTVSLKHHMEKHQRPVLDVLKDTYGEDECTRAVMAGLITRAASAPATTTTTGWAAELVQTTVGEFFSALQPMAVYPQLRARGGSFTFGRAGIVTLPSRLATPTIAGSFVGQGSPIPVRQGAFASVSLTPKKMAVISTFTREISEHSTPAIEALIRQAILEDTAVSIDSVLLDSTAASAIRPAGLRNGVSTLTPVAGGGITSLIGDLKAMVNALITSSSGNIRSPVWLMSPGDRLSMALTQAAAGGDLPFRDELTRGTLLGYPVIESTSITADTIYLIDAADFMTATGDDPRFDVSDQATLHMEDTTPLAIGTVGTPNTVASPVRSLWQTDTIGIRMLLDMNWAMRRTGMVQYTTGVLWN